MSTPPHPAETLPPCAGLPSLLNFADGRPVGRTVDWAARRAEIKGLMEATFIGAAPRQTPDLVDSRVLEDERDEAGSRRERIELQFDTPNHARFEITVHTPPGDGPFPVFIMPGPYAWWHEVALEHGYLTCIYPGADKNDATDVFVEAYPQATWSLLHRRAWLGSRALDYLLTRGDGIGGQVCITGHSRDGKQALIAAAFDERITAVAASSPGSPGAAPYRFTSRDTFAEAPADFPGEWFRPALRDYTGREHELPVDAHGWYALIAPRPVLIGTAWNDGCDPTFAVERGHLAGRAVYDWLGHPERLRIRWRPGQHHSTRDRDMVHDYFDWFDLHFGRGHAKPEHFPERLIHDFDWDDWHAKQDAAALAPPNAEADRAERIAWLLGEPPDVVSWDDRQGEQAGGTHHALGLEPPEPVPHGTYSFLLPEESKMMTHDRWAIEGVTRQPVSFGENIRGNLYHRADLDGPAPVVIWLHPLSYHSGYNEGYPGGWSTPEGGRGRTTIYHWLAAAGYVVLAFDQCGFGLRLLEGRDFYQQHPRWSRMGRMVHDVRRAVDFITTGEGATADAPPPMDPQRIYPVGYAIGGTVALLAAALDPRITGVASVCGVTPWRGDGDEQQTGGIRRWWQWHALLPKLGLFHGREGKIPLDFGDLLAEVAPRPCFIEAPRRNRTVEHQAVLDCIDQARPHWQAAGHVDRLTLHTPDEPNQLLRGQQDRLAAWLQTVTRLGNA